MGDFFIMLWDNVVSFFRSVHWIKDTLDIAIVAFIIYNIIKLVRDSRAEQLLKGILIFGLTFVTAIVLDLKAMYYLLKMLLDNILIVVIIVFQPEIRRALEHVGHSRLRKISLFGDEAAEQEMKRWQRAISAVCTAFESLQRQRMGALVVFERTTKLGEIVNSGTILDADATPELVGNVFFNKAPLHDGAMIVREGKVYAAGCILPLSDNWQISSELGTRHRAGVGMSENSDAMVVILSEETGTISLAVGGQLKRNFSLEALRVALENGILWDHVRKDDDADAKPKNPFRRWRAK